MSSAAGSAVAKEREALAGLHPLTRIPAVGRRPRRLAGQVPAPYSVVGNGADVPALLTRMYAMVVRDHWGGGAGDETHVVQLTPWYACDLGFELVLAGRIFGQAPIHHDVSPDLPVDAPEPDEARGVPADAPTPTLVSVRHSRIDGGVRAILADATRSILVADTARSNEHRVRAAVAELRGLGIVVAGLVVYEGRIPLDASFG